MLLKRFSRIVFFTMTMMFFCAIHTYDLNANLSPFASSPPNNSSNNVLSSGVGFNPQNTPQGNYFGSDGQSSKSGFCYFTPSSSCKTLQGIKQYIQKGCIDDISKPSTCIRTFVMANCLDGSHLGLSNSICSKDSNTNAMCQKFSKTINLSNPFYQQGLIDCVGSDNAMTIEQANLNESQRGQYNSYLKQQAKTSQETLKQSQLFISQLISLSKSRLQLIQNVGGKDMAGVLKNSDDVGDASFQMFKLTKELYSGLPNMTAIDQSKVTDGVKKAWLISSGQVQQYLESLAKLSAKVSAFENFRRNLRTITDPDFNKGAYY